jgi:hypothetical protein
MNLFISLYSCHSIERYNEILFCLKSNINNNYIKRILVLDEGFDFEGISTDKLEIIQYSKRPFFSDFFQYFKDNEINIISNNDIWFDSSIKYANLIRKSEVLALTRRDQVDSKYILLERCDSQDCWFFFGVPKIELNFYLGIPGCDNKILFLLKTNNWIISNPSKIIKIYHEHGSNYRTYSNIDRIPSPYLWVKNQNIFQWNLMYIFQKILTLFQKFK